MSRVRWLGFVAWVCAASACLSGGEPFLGLAPRPADDQGPTVFWDVDAKPLPEIPFPNDIGTRSDPSSPTGLRLNVSEEAPTAHERKLRRLINQLDGWGTYGGIWVRFGGRLDIAKLARAQHDADPTNDGIYLVNVDRRSPRFGERMPLALGGGPEDLGKTQFPVGLERRDNYFINDPRRDGSNILFETYDEDSNGNGFLDEHEDTDDDGRLDMGNLWRNVLHDGDDRLQPYLDELVPLGVSASMVRQYYDLFSFYELETDTLIARPLRVLEERTTYAVVLTRDIVGVDSGSPITSPFPFVNHAQQTRPLSPLVNDGLLTDLGLSVDDVAFAWSYTTQTIHQPVETIRAGLYGLGTMSRLDQEFPPRLSRVGRPEVPEFARDGNLHILEADRLITALEDPNFGSSVGLDPSVAAPIFAAFRQFVDYFVFTEYESPAFIENSDGVFRVDAGSGGAEYGRATVQLTCAVPKPSGGRTPPFPVVFYSHGYTSSRFEMLGFASSLARFGLATCGIDAYGHGLPIGEGLIDVVRGLLEDVKLEQAADLVLASRARDLNGDGIYDSGGDFWSANTFHTRDVVRQSAIDYMQGIRIMRSFGVETMPVDLDGDGNDEDVLAGDFNRDGVADIGMEAGYYIFGQSLGGILSAVVGGHEPAIKASAPTSGSAGLTDVAIRSTQGGVVQAVFMPVMGPLIVGIPNEAGTRIDVAFDILDVNSDRQLKIASFPDPIGTTPEAAEALQVGDRLRAINLTNGEMDEVTIHPSGGSEIPGRFRLHVAADPGDRLRLELRRDGADGSDQVVRTIDMFERDVAFQGEEYRTNVDELIFLQEGFGFRRQSPSLRRLFNIAQHIMDPADPATALVYHLAPPPQRPEGVVPRNVLVVNTVGDTNVPVNAGMASGRVLGLLSAEDDALLLDNWSYEGLEDLRRFAVDACRYTTDDVLFDPDEQSDGVDPRQGPHPSAINPHPACAGSAPPPFCGRACAPAAPLRATLQTASGITAMRNVYLEPDGIHGFALPDPSLPFDYNLFEINQIGRYFATEGRELSDAACLADSSCDFFQ